MGDLGPMPVFCIGRAIWLGTSNPVRMLCTFIGWHLSDKYNKVLDKMMKLEKVKLECEYQANQLQQTGGSEELPKKLAKQQLWRQSCSSAFVRSLTRPQTG